MLVFRAPKLTDAASIAELHAKSWQQNYRGAFSDTFLDTEVLSDRIEVWKERLATPCNKQFIRIAESNGEIQGFVCAFFGEHIKYGTLLDNLHISLKMKKKGIGKRLTGLVAKEIERRYPGSGMYLWVLEQNSDAHKFYGALGGVKIETIEDHDIGDRTVLKSRYFWESIDVVLT